MRGISLLGKVAIIKYFLILKFETPPGIIKQMEKMIFKFLWKGLNNGGLNLTDFESHNKVLRLSWIPRFLDEREGLSKYFLKYNFKKKIYIYIWRVFSL